MGSSLDRIIHEHRRSGPISAPVLSAPVSQMSWRVSRIRHARAVLNRCFRGPRLVSDWSSARFDSVSQPPVLRPFQQAVLLALRLAHLVDGPVGVLTTGICR